MENADEDLFQDNLASHPFSFKKKKNKQSRTRAKATNHGGSFILPNS